MKSFHDGKVTLHAGDCLEVFKAMPENSIDAVVTDPPYHLTSIVKQFGNASEKYARNQLNVKAAQYGRLSKGFMGQQWDGGDIAFQPELWAEVLRVLKPGGHMVCFGGTRTYHRMVCAIENAGFEIRDQLAWVYGSGFPKSHDVSKGIDRAAGVEREVITTGSPVKRMIPGADQNKNGWTKDNGREFVPSVTAPATDAARQWQGWGTALKPAWEPICLARKPLSESTVAANVLRWGTGALNIDGTRIGTNGGTKGCDAGPSNGILGDGLNGSFGKPIEGLGRWPANLCHDGSPEVMAGFPDVHGAGSARDAVRAAVPSGIFPLPGDGNRFGDSGSVARFFASFPQEGNQCQSMNGHASFAESSFVLSNEVAVSALSRAVEASTQRLVLHPQSYRARDMNVSALLFDGIGTLLTGTIQNIEKRFMRGLQLERLSLSDSHAKIVATPNPTGTITITISLLKSSGFVGAAMFDLTRTSLEAGASDSAKRFHYTSKADSNDRLNSKHPTVKPVDLMQWLVRLVCPKGATVLDPFAGTGTTGAAAFIEGCRAVLIERETEYLADIERRMGLLLSGPDERSRKLAKPDPIKSLPLFS
jgi:DNA modification methylase